MSSPRYGPCWNPPHSLLGSIVLACGIALLSSEARSIALQMSREDVRVDELFGILDRAITYWLDTRPGLQVSLSCGFQLSCCHACANGKAG